MKHTEFESQYLPDSHPLSPISVIEQINDYCEQSKILVRGPVIHALETTQLWSHNLIFQAPAEGEYFVEFIKRSKPTCIEICAIIDYGLAHIAGFSLGSEESEETTFCVVVDLYFQGDMLRACYSTLNQHAMYSYRKNLQIALQENIDQNRSAPEEFTNLAASQIEQRIHDLTENPTQYHHHESGQLCTEILKTLDGEISKLSESQQEDGSRFIVQYTQEKFSDIQDQVKAAHEAFVQNPRNYCTDELVEGAASRRVTKAVFVNSARKELQDVLPCCALKGDIEIVADNIRGNVPKLKKTTKIVRSS